MHDTLINIIRNSDAVVYSTVTGTGLVQVGDEQFVRTEVKVQENFKGPLSARQIVTIDIPAVGKETPNLIEQQGLIFFLRKQNGTVSEKNSRWFLVDLSAPLPVPENRHDAFIRYIRQYVKLATGEVSEDELKKLIFQMLQSGIGFFRNDAARLAMGISEWDNDQIEQLIQIIRGNENQIQLAGNELDILSAVVSSNGNSARVVSFGRTQLKTGYSDGVYFGLVKRKNSDIEEILWKFLKDSDPDVQITALRIVGLLRKSEIINEFERLHGDEDEKHRFRAAIEKARRLVTRD